MTYTHLPTDERVMVEASYHQNIAVAKIAKYLKRTRTPIHNVINFLKKDQMALSFTSNTRKTKKRCGRRKMVLPLEQQTYIKGKIAPGWTPRVIIGRKEMPIDCFMRTLPHILKIPKKIISKHFLLPSSFKLKGTY